jgi:hypothetical protein
MPNIASPIILTRFSPKKAALARLRTYKPPSFPIWDRLPVTRRAAVLILLFADRRGDLRVVITMRATSLRNFSGKKLLIDALKRRESKKLTVGNYK